MKKILVVLMLIAAFAAISYAVYRHYHAPFNAAPPRTLGGGKLPAPRESIVSVPISILRTDIEDLLNSRVPGSYPIEKVGTYKLKAGVTVPIDYRVHGFLQRGPISFAQKDQTFTATTRCNGPITGRSLGIQETASLIADLAISARPQIDQQWKVKGNVNGAVNLKKSEIHILGIPASIRELVGEAIQPRVVKLIESLNEKVAKVDLHAKVEKVWSTLDTTRLIRSNPPVWLQLQPAAFQLSDPHMLDDRLELRLGLRCSPFITVGSRPEPRPTTPLPAPEAAGNPGFSVDVPARISYADLEKQALINIAKGKIKLPKDVRIAAEDVAIYPSGDRLVVGMKLNASVPGRWFNQKGWIYVWGTPHWNPSTETIEISDFDFYQETRSSLIDSSDWLSHDALKESLRELLKWNMSPMLLKAKTAANSLLKSYKIADGIILHATLDRLEISALALERSELALGAFCSGDAAIEVEAMDIKGIDAPVLPGMKNAPLAARPVKIPAP